MSADRPIDEDLNERAVSLLQSGVQRLSKRRRSVNREVSGAPVEISMALRQRNADIENTLDAYFGSLQEADVQRALNILDYSGAAVDDVQHAVKLLAAYFRWASITGLEVTRDGRSIAPFASRFAVAISHRLAGDAPDSDEEHKSVQPRWIEPDVALGWKKPGHRTSDPGLEDRDIGIVAMWHKLEAEEVEPGIRKKRIGAAFGVSNTSIHRALKGHPDLRALFRTERYMPLIDACVQEALANAHLRSKK